MLFKERNSSTFSDTPKTVKGHTVVQSFTYTVVDYGLKRMLDFLAHAVALQDVNDTQVQK